MSRPLFDSITVTATSIYDTFRELLVPVLSHKAHTELSFQPQALSLSDVTLVIVLFLLRSLFHSLAQCLPGKSANGTSKEPSLTLSMPLQLSVRDLDQYGRALKHDTKTKIDMNNPQLLLFLSSITEPAMLLLLAKRNCPVRPLGAVNVRNRFELIRADGKPSPLFQATHATVTASLHAAPRTVKRGLEYDIETTLLLRDPESGAPMPVFRQIFTMLQFQKVDQSAVKPTAKDDRVSSAAAMLPINVDFDEPSNWAAISKDYNPIHIFHLAAKMYGFPGKIAHGNHVVAKAIYEITGRSRESAKALLKMNMPIWMEVDFRRPMTVPAQFGLHVIQDPREDTVAEFEILQGEKKCIIGALGKL